MTPEEQRTDEISQLFSITTSLEKSVSRLEANVESVVTTVQSLAGSVAQKSQTNWTMIGSFIAAFALVWTIFAFGFATIGTMAVQSVKSETTRNESNIVRLQDADHLNQKHISALEMRVNATEIELEQQREFTKDMHVKFIQTREFSLEGHTRQEGSIHELFTRIGQMESKENGKLQATN